MERHLICGLIGLGFVVGCSGRPGRVDAPDWEPAAIAETAITDLDKNSDGVIDANEIKAAPGLAYGMKELDTDGDGKITKEEIEARVTRYAESRLGLMDIGLQLFYKQRPVANAQIELVPEPCLGGAIVSAKGQTGIEGFVYPKADKPDLPKAVVQPGYYRVKVTGGNAPAEFGTDNTPLGVEVSPFSYDTSGTIRLDLDS